ncbi:MAG TPA: nucleoside triphosphate pyrophosphohydrolase [Bacteroidia bacterium]|jgi:XTP/dITP diphosphohydrolase|nr:nucleoside triphosphate pyrophosphohydrolase [Bacteroidia bacterium]
MKEKLEAFERLLNIMDDLREKCPWDKKQTIESLRHLTIEETYELSDAILKNNSTELKKELGDILLHIVFYARIASETDQFNITDVMNSLCDKLIFRHPHIYGDVKVNDEEDVKRNWENLKQKEKGGNTSVLSGVPNSMPALLKAYRIQEKARAVGFDWEHPEQVFEKVREEIEELKSEVDKENNITKIEDEFGDVLFSLINYARFLKVNPEDALERTNKKFTKRFNYMEEKIKAQGKQLADCTLAEMDVFWNEAKKL